MLYDVRFRCNHVHTMALTGQAEDRARKIAWYSQMICPECRAHFSALHPDSMPAFRAFTVPTRSM